MGVCLIGSSSKLQAHSATPTSGKWCITNGLSSGEIKSEPSKPIEEDLMLEWGTSGKVKIGTVSIKAEIQGNEEPNATSSENLVSFEGWFQLSKSQKMDDDFTFFSLIDFDEASGYAWSKTNCNTPFAGRTAECLEDGRIEVSGSDVMYGTRADGAWIFVGGIAGMVDGKQVMYDVWATIQVYGSYVTTLPNQIANEPNTASLDAKGKTVVKVTAKLFDGAAQHDNPNVDIYDPNSHLVIHSPNPPQNDPICDTIPPPSTTSRAVYEHSMPWTTKKL